MTVKRRGYRIAAGRWSFRSALVPNWIFWLVTCATAVIAGLLIAWVGGPQSVTPVETGAPQARGERGQSDAASSDDSVATVTEVDPLADLVGVRVQVLNATSTEDAAEQMAVPLEEMGLRIENVEIASRVYRRTTVFWTRGEGRAPGQALASYFGWRSAPKPGNLTNSIPVHVVVGEDEAR